MKLKLKNNIDLALSYINQGFISHISNEAWGYSILIMENIGKAFCRIYWFNDDNNTVYLDWISVDTDMRHQGIGTMLQEIRENIGIALGAKVSCLWVKKNTWQHNWYKRRGYEDWKVYEQDENAVWMIKSLV